MIKRKSFRVIIALDPTEPELTLTGCNLSWFNQMVEEKNASLEAVYVPYRENVAMAISEIAFKEYVKEYGFKNEVSAKVIHELSSSRKKAVDTLVRYAKDTEADLIAVSSHGRHGLGRFILGSFAERLLGCASIPVLFLGNSADETKEPKKILFPTDLSKASEVTLELFLEQFKNYTGEIVLFHAMKGTDHVYDTGLMGIPIYMSKGEWLELERWTKKECERLLNKIKSKGFRVNEAQSIQDFALDENIGFIAMASLRRGLESAIMGSVAKEVFRIREWPVWVCGPEAISELERS